MITRQDLTGVEWRSQIARQCWDDNTPQHSTLDSSPVGRVDKSARCQTGAGQESKKQHSNDFRARPAVWLEPVLALKPPSPGLNHHGFAGCLPAHLRKMTTRWWGKWAREHSLISTLCSGYVKILHCDVMWCDVRHTLILTTSTPAAAPGNSKIQMRRCCAYFSIADQSVARHVSRPALPSVISIMSEFFAHYFPPEWVATMHCNV